jgi:hypothetical protein
MSDPANVVFILGFVQSDGKIKSNKILQSKYGEKRRFYSCKDGGDTDYLRYVDKGTREPNAVIEADYVGYSGNNEKSSGIFNGKGMLTKKERFDLRKQLQTTESAIWHGIISFEEAFGNRYCGNAEQAQRLMAIEFPRFLKSAGFDPDKIVWYAGLHENTDNRHIHLSFFEREPSRYTERGKGLQYSRGKIAGRHFERFKVAVELRLTDISSQIAASRKELTGLFGSVLFSKTNKARYFDELQKGLTRLTRDLPASGRLAYDSENMRDLKPRIKEIVNLVIKSKGRLYYQFEDYCSRVKAKDAKTLAILKAGKVRESDRPRYLIADKYLDDVYRRLGNQIIGAVRVVKNREKKTGSRLANKRIRRRTVLGIMEYALKLDSEIEREAMEAFEEYLERLENEKITVKGGAESEME